MFELMWQRIPRSPHEPLSNDAVIGTWRCLVERLAVIGRIVESPDLDVSGGIVVGGFSAFVREEWLRDYLRAPFPHPGRFILEECAKGNTASILLADDEVADANSGVGLCSVTLGLIWRIEHVPVQFRAEALHRSVRSFSESHDGYRIAQILNESIGEHERQMFLGSGAWQALHVFADGDDAQPSVVVGMTREAAADVARSASSTAPLFIVRQPRYCFEPGQQELLLQALDHVNDKDLADVLDISPSALRRRWQRIFHRIQVLQPADDPMIPRGLDSAGKRARVLLRLAHEMHELRPHIYRRRLGQPAP